MYHSGLLALTHNAALLLAMLFIYDMATSSQRTELSSFKAAPTGLALGLIGIIIMLSPWEYAPGIIIDTRSVLLGISGLFFGAVPTLIAMVMTATLRLFQGGEAAIAGVAVITSSGSLGIIWHYYRQRPLSELSGREIYLFGIIIHVVMLAMIFILPWDVALKVLSNISFPVLLLFPLITVLLGMLFTRRLQRKQTTDALQESEFLFRSQFDLGNIGVAITSPEKCWLRVNPQLCELLGYSQEELLQLTWSDLTHPEDLPLDLDKFKHMLAGDNDGYSLDKRFIRKDGETVYAHMTVACYRVRGKVQFAIAGMLDTTESKHAEAKLLASQEQLISVLAGSELGFWDWNIETNTVQRNVCWANILGHSFEEIQRDSQLSLDAIHPDDREATWQSITDHLEGRSPQHKMEYRILTKQGEYKWILDCAKIVNYGQDGRPLRMCGTLTDITDKKKAEEIIWHQANFDSLTGLANRQMFLGRLEQEKNKAYCTGQPMALLFLDLDRFKEVNDTLGHNMGDRLLKDVAERLRNSVRETDTVARLGGDEFTIIITEQDNPHGIERVAKEILRKFSAPFSLGAENVFISPSIGISLYPQDGTDADTLLMNADLAMYTAKADGRNRYYYFSASMKEKSQHQRLLITQ